MPSQSMLEAVQSALLEFAANLGAAAVHAEIVTTSPGCQKYRTSRPNSTFHRIAIGDPPPDLECVTVMLSDEILGNFGTVWIYADQAPATLREGAELSSLTCWSMLLLDIHPEVVFEICARRGELRPILHVLTSELGAMAGAVWELKASARSYQCLAGVSIPDHAHLDIPSGLGIIGGLTRAEPVVTVSFNLTTAHHPDLVEAMGWEQTHAHLLFDHTSIYGAFALYFAGPTGARPVQVKQVRLIFSARSAMTSILRMRAIERERDEWQRTLANKLGRLQTGLAVLGLSHDLSRQADQLSSITDIITSCLPQVDNDHPEARTQMRRQLERFGISNSRIELFLNNLTNASQTSAYISQLIDLINKIAKETSPTRKKLDLRDAVEAIAPMLAAMCRNEAHFEHKISRSVRVRASEADIARILLNLVSNSLHWQARQVLVLSGAATSEPIRSHLRSLKLDAIPDIDSYCALIVSDNGIGMPPEVLEQCREPFSTQREGGTGLGLFVVEWIVKDLRGTVHISSRLREGTEVVVLLPRLDL